MSQPEMPENYPAAFADAWSKMRAVMERHIVRQKMAFDRLRLDLDAVCLDRAVVDAKAFDPELFDDMMALETQRAERAIEQL